MRRGGFVTAIGAPALADPGGVRVMYLQYTNPAAYPPLEHSALLLAEAGCRVLLVGVGLLGEVLKFAEHPRIEVRLYPAVGPGWRQKLHYVRFVTWVARQALRFRPHWIYASDPLSAPIALTVSTLGTPVVYHEHDSPAPALLADERSTPFSRLIASGRSVLARRASVCVLPSLVRARAFAAASGREDVVTMWNVPLAREVSARGVRAASGLRLLYHGSIVPARVPTTLLHALALSSASTTLRIAGYDPEGGRHVALLRSVVSDLGLGSRVEFAGTIATRHELLRQCAECDVGVSLMPLQTTSFNEQTMLGASNKPFDYLASGLALLVADLPDWRTTFVDGGFGRACDPGSVESLRAAIQWFEQHPQERGVMGERGRRKIVEAWNYEQAFGPVFQRIMGSARSARPGAIDAGIAEVRDAGSH